MTILDTRLAKGSQTLRGVRIVQVRYRPHPRILRAKIERDSSDAQSHAVVETWTRDGWAEVATVPIRDLPIEGCSPYQPTPWEPTMLLALDQLIDLGTLILQEVD